LDVVDLIKLVKQKWSPVGRNADAGIGDAYGESILGRDQLENHAAGGGVFDRIIDQVADQPLKLLAIGLHLDVALANDLQRQAALLGAGTEALLDAIEDAGDGNIFDLVALFAAGPGEIQDFGDVVAGRLGAFHDVQDAIADFVWRNDL